MGFPSKNDHFGVFWGYYHSRKHLPMEKRYTKSIAVISILIPPKLRPRFNLASCGHEATGGCGLRSGSKREIGDLGCSIRQWVHVDSVDVDGCGWIDRLK